MYRALNKLSEHIYTFTYQKTILHVFFYLFLKSSKAFNMSLNNIWLLLQQLQKRAVIIFYFFIFTNWSNDPFLWYHLILIHIRKENLRNITTKVMSLSQTDVLGFHFKYRDTKKIDVACHAIVISHHLYQIISMRNNPTEIY